MARMTADFYRHPEESLVPAWVRDDGASKSLIVEHPCEWKADRQHGGRLVVFFVFAEVVAYGGLKDIERGGFDFHKSHY